jgi:glutathione S-transferase
LKTCGCLIFYLDGILRRYRINSLQPALFSHITCKVESWQARNMVAMNSTTTSFTNRSHFSTHHKITPQFSHIALRSVQYKLSRRPSSARSVPVVADMFASLKSMLSKDDTSRTAAAAPSRTPLFFSSSAPTWEELQAMVDKQDKELGIVPQDLETGPASPAALRRTFGQPGEPRVKLYRDHAAWCPYCHKVVLQLEEKKIPYIIEKINMRVSFKINIFSNFPPMFPQLFSPHSFFLLLQQQCYGGKPPEFLAKVPSGLLPVLEIDGKIITESAVIQGLLEELYPEPALLPKNGTQERARASALMRLERRLFSDWLQWLCNSWGNDGNRVAFENTMDTIDKELGAAEGPYFLSNFSLVDIIFAPFLERVVASIPYYKGVIVRGQGRYPNLDRWFEAMETREPYLAFRSDFYTHCHDLPPQLGGCVSTPESLPFAAAIDGTDGESWHLPLSPLTPTSLEPFCPGEDPVKDRLRAARQLVSNHVNVTKFALRGVGQPGPRPVFAPLSDPTAISGMEYEAEVDAALRYVAAALLIGVQSDGEPAVQVVVSSSQQGPGSLSGAPVVPSFEYMRDRVGVPRDMPLPAARQLRAHLNWFIDTVAPAASS